MQIAATQIADCRLQLSRLQIAATQIADCRLEIGATQRRRLVAQLHSKTTGCSLSEWGKPALATAASQTEETNQGGSCPGKSDKYEQTEDFLVVWGGGSDFKDGHLMWRIYL